jgi:amidase
LIVPAGFSTEDLPIGISFIGPAFSESRLLAIGYAFEQSTKARRLPIHTPLRSGDAITIPQ